MGALGSQIAFGFDAGLLLFQITVPGDEVLLQQILVVTGALLGNGAVRRSLSTSSRVVCSSAW